MPVLEDGSPEEDEAFTVTLSNVVNVTIGDSTGTGTIQDDDPVPPSLSIEDAVALESREAMEFPVTLSGDREEGVTVTVDYATKNRTAEAGKDYTETTGTLTFAPDVTEQTIRVPLLDDVIDEGHDIFVVLLSNAMGATFGDSLAEGKILDDDIASTKITLIASPARISEDDGATDIDVTAMLDGAARTSAIEVTVSVAGSGTAGAVDFAELEDFTITIAALHNRGTGTFTLTPIDDDVDESDETLSVTGTSFMTVTGTEVELVDDDATSSSIALVAVANHPPPSVRQLVVHEPRQALLELRRHRRLDQPSRARAQQFRQRVLNHRWHRQRNHFIVAHVWRAPLAKSFSRKLDFSRDTPHNSTHLHTTFDHSSRRNNDRQYQISVLLRLPCAILD